MFDWSRIRLIVKRELTTRFKQRSYRVTLVIQLLVAALAALAPIGIAWFSDGDTSSTDNAAVIVVDEADAGIAPRLESALAEVDDALPAIEVRTDVSTADDARAQVEDGDTGYAVIVTGAAEGELAYELVSEDGGTNSVEAQRILGAVTTFSVEHMAEQRGLTAEEAQRLVAPPEIRIQDVSGEEGSGGIEDMLSTASGAEYAIAYVGAILIYMAIILYGTWVATGVAEEKGSRIMEIMVNAATPRDLMAGKVIGIMLAGLAQLLPMVLVAGTLFALQPRIADAVGVELTAGLDIDFAAISVKAAAAFLAYFLLGFILYGGFYAGIGSMVSRQEEVNQAVSPMMTLVVISFFGAIVALSIPDALFTKVLFIVPISSPFVALPRILLGTPSAGEIALSLGLLALAAVGAMWLAARFYRTGVLMYGQRPSWIDMVKMTRTRRVAR